MPMENDTTASPLPSVYHLLFQSSQPLFPPSLDGKGDIHVVNTIFENTSTNAGDSVLGRSLTMTMASKPTSTGNDFIE
jgi:hypothetical protein